MGKKQSVNPYLSELINEAEILKNTSGLNLNNPSNSVTNFNTPPQIYDSNEHSFRVAQSFKDMERQAILTTFGENGMFRNSEGNLISSESLLRMTKFGLNAGAFDDKLMAYSKERPGEKLGIFHNTEGVLDKNKDLPQPGADISALYPVYDEELGKYILKATEPGFPAINEARKASKNILDFYGKPEYSDNVLSSFSKSLTKASGTLMPNLVNMSDAVANYISNRIDPMGLTDDPKGQKETEEWLKNFNQYWRELGTNSFKESQFSQNNPYSLEGSFSSIGSGVGSVLQYTALASGTKGLLGKGLSEKTALQLSMASSGMILNGGEAYEQALNAGLSPEERGQFMLAVGGINTAIEMGFGANNLAKYLVLGHGAKEIGETILKETNGNLTKEAVAKVAPSITRKILNKVNDFTKIPVIGTGYEESLEEFSQSMTSNTAEVTFDKLFAEDVNVGEGKFGTRINENTLKQSLKEAYSGALTGMLMGIPGAFSEKQNKLKKISDNSIVDNYISKGKEQFVKDQAKNLLSQQLLTQEEYEDFEKRVNYLVNIRDNNKDLFFKYENSGNKDRWISEVIKTIDENNNIINSKENFDLNNVRYDLINHIITNKELGTLNKFKNQLEENKLNKSLEVIDFIDNSYDALSKVYTKKFDRSLMPIYISAEADNRILNKNLDEANNRTISSLGKFQKSISKNKRLKTDSNILLDYINTKNSITNTEYYIDKVNKKLNEAEDHSKLVLEKTKSILENKLKEDLEKLNTLKIKSIPKSVLTSAEYNDYIIKKSTEETLRNESLEAESFNEINESSENRKLLLDEINRRIENKIKDTIKTNLSEAHTPEEVHDILNTRPEAVEEQEFQEYAEGTSPEAFDKMVNKASKEVVEDQEGIVISQLNLQDKSEFESINEALTEKYKDKAALLLSDFNKISNYITDKKFREDFTEEERRNLDLSRIANLISMNLSSENKPNVQSLIYSIKDLDVNNPLHKKFLDKILGIINESYNKINNIKAEKNTELSSEDPNKGKEGLVGTHIKGIKGEDRRYALKDYDSGREFAAATKIGDVTINGVNQKALDSYKIQQNDEVSFEVDKDKEWNKEDWSKRGFDIVVYKGKERIVIGKVPTVSSKMKQEDQDYITNLRKTLHDRINKKYNKSDKIVKSGITSNVSGFFYTITRTEENGTPLERISEEIRKNFTNYGGFTLGYLVTRGENLVISDKSNLPIDIVSNFKLQNVLGSRNNGAYIIVVPHPLKQGEYLYLRAFGKKLGEVKNNPKVKDKYEKIVENLRNLFVQYADKVPYSEESKTIWKEIKNIIVGDFEITSDGKLYLKTRTEAGKGKYLINKENIVKSEELVKWIDDQVLNVDNRYLNREGDYDIGYGLQEGVYYNELINDFLNLDTEVGMPINEVQPLIKQINLDKEVKTEEPINKEIQSNIYTFVEEPEEKVIQTINLLEEGKEPTTKKTIKYTPKGKQEQVYTIEGTKILNKEGNEVFKEGSVDRNKIFANLAVSEGRAVVVEHKNNKYVVNNKDQIISVTSGSIMKWGEENGDRRIILEKANNLFQKKEEISKPKVEPKKETKRNTSKPNLSSLTNEVDSNLVKNLTKNLKKELDKNKDENRPKARKADDLNSPKWNKEEELAWFKKNFPNVDISVLENLKEVVANGKDLWGVFHNAAVYITKEAAEGTTYHEAFHVVFNLFATPEQRKTLLKEAASKYKEIKKSNYKSVEDYEEALEESLSDDFMDYVMFEQTPKSLLDKIGKVISDFFRKLKQIIKSLQSNPVYNIDEFFWRANNGFYSKSKVDPGQFKLNITRGRVKGWTWKHEKEAVSVVNRYLIDKILPSYRESNIDYRDLTDVQLINQLGLDKLYKTLLVSLTETAETESEEIRDNIYELINNFYDVTTGEWKELKDSCLRNLNDAYNIKINNDLKAEEVEEFDSEESIAEEVDENNETSGAEDKVENWSNTAQEKSTKDNAPAEVKKFIRHMDSGKKSSFGFDSPIDYEETYDTLLRNLAGSTNVNEMLDYLKYEINLNFHPEYQQIVDKMESDSRFSTQFFIAFNNHNNEYNIASQIGDNIVIYQANRKGLTNSIITTWIENILNNNNLIKTDEKGNRTVDIEYAKKNVEEIKDIIKDVINNWNKNLEVSYYDDLSKALEKLSITIPAKVFHYIGSLETRQKTGKGVLNDYFFGTNSLEFILNKFAEGHNPFDAEGGDEARETEAIKKIAYMVTKASPELYESSFRNISGKTVYAHLTQNFTTKLTNRFKNPNRRESIENKENDIDITNYYKDGFFYKVNSKGKKYLFNRILKGVEDGTGIFNIQLTEGLTENNERTHYKDFDHTKLSIYTLANYFFNGKEKEAYYRAPVLSDAPVGIMFKHVKQSKKLVLQTLADLAAAEYRRIKEIGEQMKSLKPSDYMSDYHIPENATLDSGYHLIQGMRTYGKKVDLAKNRKEVEKHIEDWLDKEADIYYRILKRDGIIVVENGLVSNKSRLPLRMLKNSKGEFKSEEDIKEYITEFYFNDFLSRAEFNLVTTGDPAFYKSSESGNNKTVDYIKRAKEIHSPKSILDVEGFYLDPETGKPIKVGATYRTIYLKDNKIQSPSFEGIKSTIEDLVEKKIISEQKGKEIIASYGYNKEKDKGNINQTDAQAYITLPFYRKTMIGMGGWTDKHQAAYKRLEKGLGTGEDISLVLQPFKPFMYGRIYSEKLGRYIPVQNKNSEYLLLPQLVKGNEKLQNLYNFMIGADIDSANFESAVKVGLNNVLDTSVFDNQESTENFIKNDYIPNNSSWIQSLNMEDRGIQQEVPEHFRDSENLFGTQIRKHIMSDLFEGTTYLNGMPKDELRKFYEDLIIQDLVDAYQELEDKIVLSKDEDGKPKEINYEFIHKLLLEEAKNIGKSEEFEKVIQYDKARKRLILPLYNPVTTKTAENLITSIFKTRITKQKINGGAFVQVSSFGLSNELELKFYKEGNLKGGLEYAEVMLPAWSREFFKDFMNQDGEVDFASIQHNAPELLEMIGYRIPTEDKYSMLPLKVVGFLPYNAGGAIMLPADITKISGSDFDVDKMYVMMKTFKRNMGNINLYEEKKKEKLLEKEELQNKLLKIFSEKYPEIKININDFPYERDLKDILLQQNNGKIIGQANIKALEILIDAVNKKEDTLPHEYAHFYINWFKNNPIVKEGIKRFGGEEKLVQAIGEQVVKQEGEAYNWWKKFTNWILNLMSDKEILQVLTDSFINRIDLENDFTYENKKLYETYKYDYSKSAKENSKKARNNAKIDVILSILRNPNTLESILSGGTFVPLQNIAKVTEYKIGSKKIELNPVGLLSMDKMFMDNMTGKAMTGIATNETTFHAIAQHTKMKLRNPVLFDGDKLTSLHETKAKKYIKINPETYNIEITDNSIEKQKISKNKAYYSSAIVDNAKDPVASYINYNKYTSGIVGLFSQLGIDPATITWFLKQPVIVDITRKFFENSGDYNIERNILEEYKTKFGVDEEEAFNLNTKDLFDHLDDRLDSDYQRKVFNSFLVYKKMAKDWTTVILSCRADASGFGPTNSDAEVLIRSINKILDPKEDFSILGAEELFNLNSEGTRLVANFTEYGIKKPMEITKLLFPYYNPFYKTCKDIISSDLVVRDASAKELNKINNQITAYLLSKFDLFSQNDRDYYLNKFPQEFLEFKKNNPIFAENYLIRRLEYRSKLSDPKTPIERLEFNNAGKLTNELKTDIQQSWEDLKDNGFEDMAKKLFIYTYFTTGLQYDVNGFAHLSPVDFLLNTGFKDSKGLSLGEFMYDLIDNKLNMSPKEAEKNATIFVNQFYRNNYKNKAYVPKVNKEKSNITETVKDDKGHIIGFKVNIDVKDKSILRGDSFPKFISYDYKNKTYLYEKSDEVYDYDSKKVTNATYSLTDKLGFPNYIYEYMDGAENYESVLDINKVPKDITEEEETPKPLTNITVVDQEVTIEDINGNLVNIKINTYNQFDEKGYKIDLIYNNKSYMVTKERKTGKMINSTGKEISDKGIINLVEKVVKKINETHCG